MNSERLGRVPHGGLAIARQNLDFDPGLAGARRSRRPHPDAGAAAPQRHDRPRHDGRRRRKPRDPGTGFRWQADPRRRTTACPIDLEPVDEAPHALPCDLLDPASGDLRRRRGPPRRRPDDGWRAQAGRPVEHVFGMLAHSRHRVPARSAFPSCRTRPASTSASRSMASPELSSTPERNMAPDTTVCTAGIARPSAQGQVMMRTAIAGDDGIVPGRAERHPAQHGQKRRGMHHRRIEPRRAVGQLHVAGARLHGIVEQPAISASSVPSDAADTRTRNAPERLSVPA
jgi:hypothetical protein